MARGEEDISEEDYEEEEYEDEDEDEEDDIGRHRNKDKKRSKSSFIDDAAEEDDEEEEGGGRRLKRSRFIDDIAEVDDDEEEDDNEEDDMHELIDDTGEDIPDAADLMKMRHRDVELGKLDDEINPEELQQYLDQRFGGRAYAPVGGEEEEVGAVSQQLLLPTPSDPKLWVVRCGEGQEREAIICLLQKCYDLANKGQPLLIKSAFCQDHLQGYLYVEAFKEAHVKEALRGLRMIYGSKPPRLVPIKEMVDAVTVPKSSSKPLDIGDWVRVKSGVYKGDLAKVVDLNQGEGKATIRLVPRLDLAAIANRKPEDHRANFGKQPKIRPAAKPFNPEEARTHKLDVIQQRDRSTGEVFYILNGTQRFCEGYLQKVVSLRSILQEHTLPPLDELQRYNAAAQSEEAGSTDLEGLIQNLHTEGAGVEVARPTFSKGDKVIAIEGDLKNIRGVVEQIREDGDVMVRPDDTLLKGFEDLIPFKPRELSKFFEGGNHVKVVHGQHNGETGMVVRVEGPVCYVFTDTTQQEIRVFTRDLTEAAAMASSADTLAGYELHDLVSLDGQTFGVIVGVEQEACRVLTNQGRPEKPDIRVCRLPDIQKKLMTRRNVAQDAGRNDVNQNDIVDVVDGPLKGKSGTVRHVMRGVLFIQSREIHENGGFVCVRAMHCKVRGGKRPPGGGMNPLMTPSRGPGYGGVMASPHPYRSGPSNVLASPSRHGGGPQGGGYGGRPGPGTFSGRVVTQQDKLLEGKVITVKKGPYRGMRGRVVTATGTHVRLELEAQMKMVSVDRSHLALEDGGIKQDAQQQRPMYGGPTATPMHAGGRTPAHPGIMATPMHYSHTTATPMHPGMTPARDGAITKTPAYDPAWAGMTPAHPGISGGPGYPQAPTPSYSPSFHADTPGIAPSPGMGPYMHPSPAMAYSPAMAGTPGIAHTPGGATPGGPMGDPAGLAGNSYEHWGDVEVRLTDGGELAVVREMLGDGTATVQMGSPDEAEPDSTVYLPDAPTRSVPLKGCALTAPERKDPIKVLHGDLAGQTGELVGTDGSDGIIKIAGDVKILGLVSIGKYVPKA